MNVITLGYGDVKLHSGAIMKRKDADAISGWLERIYIMNSAAYANLIIAHGRREAVKDPLTLAVVDSDDAPVRLLDVNNKLTLQACMVIHAILQVSISGEPQCPYSAYDLYHPHE